MGEGTNGTRGRYREETDRREQKWGRVRGALREVKAGQRKDEAGRKEGGYHDMGEKRGEKEEWRWSLEQKEEYTGWVIRRPRAGSQVSAEWKCILQCRNSTNQQISFKAQRKLKSSKVHTKKGTACLEPPGTNSSSRTQSLIRDIGDGGRGWGPTVGLVCLVEDVPLKVLLFLHGGVKLGVVVLKQTHDGVSGGAFFFNDGAVRRGDYVTSEAMMDHNRVYNPFLSNSCSM